MIGRVGATKRLNEWFLAYSRVPLSHYANEATEAALDPLKIFPDVGAEEIATLLERPLFGFASYGRVRFHHQSVVEYLAARRLEALLARGLSVKAIKRLLLLRRLTRTVRPSMRPVAAWLAISNGSIFNDIFAVDPSVVLDHGEGATWERDSFPIIGRSGPISCRHTWLHAAGNGPSASEPRNGCPCKRKKRMRTRSSFRM